MLEKRVHVTTSFQLLLVKTYELFMAYLQYPQESTELHTVYSCIVNYNYCIYEILHKAMHTV